MAVVGKRVGWSVGLSVEGDALGTPVSEEMLGVAVGAKVSGVGEEEVGDAVGAEVLGANSVG